MQSPFPLVSFPCLSSGALSRTIARSKTGAWYVGPKRGVPPGLLWTWGRGEHASHLGQVCWLTTRQTILGSLAQVRQALSWLLSGGRGGLAGRAPCLWERGLPITGTGQKQQSQAEEDSQGPSRAWSRFSRGVTMLRLMTWHSSPGLCFPRTCDPWIGKEDGQWCPATPG